MKLTVNDMTQLVLIDENKNLFLNNIIKDFIKENGVDSFKMSTLRFHLEDYLEITNKVIEVGDEYGVEEILTTEEYKPSPPFFQLQFSFLGKNYGLQFTPLKFWMMKI